ncbi:hypothetical protein EDC96DRAFT_485285 [Choanephora cucurbitarum]|nr:hypothetical protein EDC96DRAFT_485285 [Choanephora cucurbitarum]
MSIQKLPSIQFLLNENHAYKSSHASINKISNLPSELQLLSLSAPATRIEQHQPSWMLPRKSPSSSHSRSISDLPPLPPTNHKRYQAHRRTMSAIATTDIPPIQNYPIRARTVSPPHEDQPKAKYENLMVARDEETGRYYCPFCNKPFNRPSSLRIHTYSHTGEKPFICQEKGCGRQFSVQSNMRRHQRVHKRSSSNKHLSK